ncbi:MAG TPA: PhpK family radical SAM P-methyltransferase [Pyrinomonadaceae bacterium]
MTDCLIIGFNDFNFDEYVGMVGAMGTDSGAYRDLNLAFIHFRDKPYRSMDLLNHFYYEDREGTGKPFHNADFMWPVVLYLGTFLHRKGLSFDYVNLFHLEKEKLKDKLLHDDILTVAITTTLYVTSQPILEIISFIRQYNEKVKIVVGGPYVINQVKMMDPVSAQELFKYIGADFYVISQEGEQALTNLIYALKNKASLDQVDNISYLQGGQYVRTAPVTESNPLEENLVDYGLFKPEEIGQFMSLRTAKSCPFSCSFCGFPQRAGKYTYTGVGLVEEELNRLHELGITTLTYLDDTFNVPKQRFRDILKMMIANNYGFKWNSFYRSDHGDPETIELMGRAGCEGVFLGIESGSDVMLKRMNKTSRRKNYQTAIPLLQAAGISVHANLIIGFPGETYETAQESIDLIEETKPDFFRAQLWYADPVTPIWEQREEYGVKGEAFSWSHNSMDSQTACDLIDKAFLTVENSDWMPQYGFEQWSTFYLQRRGMTKDQLKTFVKCFNTAVKEKLLNPHQQEITPAVLESIKRSSRFDRSELPDRETIEVLAPSYYKAAERFWLTEFAGVRVESTLDELCEQRSGIAEERVSIPIEADLPVLDGLAPSIILAAYSVLLSRLSGSEQIAVVCALGDVAFPLRLVTPWNAGFVTFVDEIQKKLANAMEHQRYGFPIVTNQWRLREHGLSCPVLDVGYRYGFDQGLDLFPEVSKGIKLILNTTPDTSNPKLSWTYQKNWFQPEIIARLGSYLSQILADVTRKPDVSLGSIVIDAAARNHQTPASDDVLEAFSF